MLKKLFGYSIATWLGALISFILIPLASHLYSSNELGIINYYYSIINIVFTFVLLGFDQVLLRFYSEYGDYDRKTLFTKSISYPVLLVVLICLIASFFSSQISNWLIGCELSTILLIIFLHLLGLIITRFFVILYRLESKLLQYSILSIVNTVLLKCVYLFGVPYKADAITGIWTTAIISFLVAVALIICKFKSFSFKKLFSIDRVTIEGFKYAVPLIPTMVFATLNNYVPQIFLRAKTNFSNIALYSVGVTIASVITLFHNGVNTFLEPYIFRNYKTNREQIAKILNWFTIGANILCMIIISVQDLFFIVFDRSYSISTQFLPILFCSSLWYTIGDFYNIGVKIAKKTRINVPIYLMGLVINAALSYFLIPVLNCVGAAIAAATASAVMSFLKLYEGNKHYQTIQNCKNIVFGAAFLIVVSTVNYLMWNNNIKYLIYAVCLIAYIVLTGVVSDVREYINKRKREERYHDKEL